MMKKRELDNSDSSCKPESTEMKEMTVKEVQSFLSKLPMDKEQVWLTMIGIIADIPYVDVRLKHNTVGKGCRGIIDGGECMKCHDTNLRGTMGYSFDIILHDPKTGDKNKVQVKGADAAGMCLFKCNAEDYAKLDKEARDNKIVDVIAEKFKFTICVMNANTASPGAVVTRARPYGEDDDKGASSSDATPAREPARKVRPKRGVGNDDDV